MFCNTNAMHYISHIVALNGLIVATLLHHGNCKEYQRATTGADSIIPLLASIWTYTSLLFFLRACLNAHVKKKHYLFTDTAGTTCLLQSQLLQTLAAPAETLPICGAGLGPSHLNLAGLTWNSLPVGLPQTLPLSQGRRPRCELQQLMLGTPPENSLQVTSRYSTRKKEVIMQLFPWCAGCFQ